MKTLILCSAIILASCTAQSNLVKSKDGYALQTEKLGYAVRAGESTTINVDVLRSRVYLDKPIALKIISPLPEGLSIAIVSQPLTQDKAVLEAITTASVKQGVYTIILSGDALIPSMPSKGIIFKLSIN